MHPIDDNSPVTCSTVHGDELRRLERSVLAWVTVTIDAVDELRIRGKLSNRNWLRGRVVPLRERSPIWGSKADQVGFLVDEINGTTFVGHRSRGP